MNDAPWEPSKGTAGLLDFALRVLNEVCPSRGRLLDIPTGVGHLATAARKAGWDAVPCDLYPEFWEGDPDLDVVRCDFNEPLPFDEASADAIVHCEGIEHVENPWQILREFRRVIRPGGTLLLSLPNTVDIRQRLRMLRRCFVGHYLPGVPEHVNRMGTFYLCHALLRTGWAIRAIRSRRMYGGVLYRALARFLAYDERCGLPPDVCAMLSSGAVLRARTVYFVATPTDVPSPHAASLAAG